MNTSGSEKENQTHWDPHKLHQRTCAWKNKCYAILPHRWADCKYFHQELYWEKVHLPSFTVGGEFISVIRILLVFSLRGGFPTSFPSFPHLDLLLSIILSYIIVQGDLWPLFLGPSNFMHFIFTPPDYSLRGGVGVIIQLTHLFGQFWPNYTLS